METTLKQAIDELLGTVDGVMERRVISLAPDTLLGEAAMRLEEAEVTGAPVVDNGRVVGMVSLTDLFRAAGVPVGLARTSGPWLRFEHVMSGTGKRVAEAMSRQVVTIRPDTPVAEAAAIMREQDVNRIPVVDASGRLCGIVAREDVVTAVAAAIHHVHEGDWHPDGSPMEPDC